MLDKTLTAPAVVGALRDGMTIGIGGWGPRRKPMALVEGFASWWGKLYSAGTPSFPTDPGIQPSPGRTIRRS